MRNLREDTLAQILSYGNVGAGRRVLVMDDCLGVLTGSIAVRMGGYGYVIALFAGFAPQYLDTIARFNLTFVEHSSIRWLHAGELFHEGVEPDGETMMGIGGGVDGVGVEEDPDYDLEDREKLVWPCHLQSHTMMHVSEMEGEQKRWAFLDKRCARFARKLTRPTLLENRALLLRPNVMDVDNGTTTAIPATETTSGKKTTASAATKKKTTNGLTTIEIDQPTITPRKKTHPPPTTITSPPPSPTKHAKADSLILACGYDPTPTLLTLLPHLETSCPFVVYSEFLEPLVHCFRALQDKQLAINLRLTDTWMRDYQVLPGRTHPNMNMSMNGGFLLTGVKLCPVFGRNER